MFFCISTKPTDSRFTVMNLGGPLCFPAESVCNRGSDITPSFYECGQSVGAQSALFIPVFPTPSVNPYDEGKFLVGGDLCGQDEVEGLPRIWGVRVREIG